jgi:hypothetical protein
MNFKEFSDLVSERFKTMQENGKLFRSSVSGNELWDVYLSSFKTEDNPIFRDPNSSTHNCNLDKSFIRRYGNVVSIDSEYNIITMWDVSLPENNEYYQSVLAMAQLLKSKEISDVFFETYDELNSLNYEKNNKKQSVYRLGINQNHKIYTQEEADKFGHVVANQVYQFNHFYCDLNKNFVDQTGASQSTIISEYRDAKNVFKRGVLEIPEDTLKLVRDLINQGSLLDGQTHLYKIDQILPLKNKFDKLNNDFQKDNWCWVNSYRLLFAKFRNELIGTLCVELAEGKELNEACRAWNKRVDPANYMKAKAPITERQIKEAQNFVTSEGYEESFDRRFATIKDINVSEILHSNVGKVNVKTASVFDNIQSTKNTTRHKRSQFDGIEEVNIEKFMQDILPTCTTIEAFFESRHEGNLVALTTTNSEESKPMFKWNNNFSWTFNGNLAGKSQIKENVKKAGGKITGTLRCSLQWNDEDTVGSIDYDLHCRTPFSEIYYSSKRCDKTRGWLDVDMINPTNVGIENITWQNNLIDGRYDFFVRNFNGGSNNGFKVEIEFGDEVFNYHYETPTTYKQDVNVASIMVKDGVMSIKHHLQESNQSKKIWGVDTNEFHKVKLVCLTPNHWGENNIGNKHYLFMVDGCKSDVNLRSFHTENLNDDLLKHRKVMEVLGNSTMLTPTDNQLCGLGFNATVKDELILKLSGTHKRTIKVKF